MSISYDTHLHTRFSLDSETPVTDQIHRAIELNLSGIVITDHNDYDYPSDQLDEDIDKPFVLNLESYLHELEKCREEYPSFYIGFGVECGMQDIPDVIEANNKLCSDKRLDMVIGSLHLLHRMDPYNEEVWHLDSPEKLIRDYFESMLININRFHNFDTLGHMDYIVRYAPAGFEYHPKDFFDITDEIMNYIIKNNIALEVNTSALKKEYGNINPHPSFLERYLSLGGTRITIGSDAHTPENMALGFDKTATLLQSIGFTEYSVYQNRTEHIISI